MSRNSSGTYTLPSGNPVVSGTVIEASWANGTLSDIASALTDSLSRSGQGGMSAPLRLTDGTVSIPSLAFANETGSGAYRAAAGDWYLTVLGSGIARLRATGVDITGALGVSGAVTGNNLVYLTGDQTIGGTKRFSSSIAVGSSAPAVNLDVQTTGANNLSSLFTTGVDDLNFRAGFMNGVAGSTGSMQARMGLFYLGSGEVATIGMYRGASATDGSIALRTAGNDRLFVNSSGNVGIATSSPSQPLEVVGNIRSVVGGVNYDISTFSLKLISGSGYQKLPGGLVIQWGVSTTSSAGSTIVYPIAFNNLFSLVVSAAAVGIPANVYVAVQAYNQVQFNVSSSAATVPCHWIAIGN